VVKVDQRQASNDEHEKELVGKKITIDLRVNVINGPPQASPDEKRETRRRKENDFLGRSPPPYLIFCTLQINLRWFFLTAPNWREQTTQQQKKFNV
jgi:hypothetical protein